MSCHIGDLMDGYRRVDSTALLVIWNQALEGAGSPWLEFDAHQNVNTKGTASTPTSVRNQSRPTCHQRQESEAQTLPFNGLHGVSLMVFCERDCPFLRWLK